MGYCPRGLAPSVRVYVPRATGGGGGGGGGAADEAPPFSSQLASPIAATRTARIASRVDRCGRFLLRERQPTATIDSELGMIANVATSDTVKPCFVDCAAAVGAVVVVGTVTVMSV